MFEGVGGMRGEKKGEKKGKKGGGGGLTGLGRIYVGACYTRGAMSTRLCGWWGRRGGGGGGIKATSWMARKKMT